jgi:hypothetical protein
MIMIAITFFEFLTYNSFICIACEGSAYFSIRSSEDDKHVGRK